MCKLYVSYSSLNILFFKLASFNGDCDGPSRYPFRYIPAPAGSVGIDASQTHGFWGIAFCSKELPHSHGQSTCNDQSARGIQRLSPLSLIWDNSEGPSWLPNSAFSFTQSFFPRYFSGSFPQYNLPPHHGPSRSQIPSSESVSREPNPRSEKPQGITCQPPLPVPPVFSIISLKIQSITASGYPISTTYLMLANKKKQQNDCDFTAKIEQSNWWHTNISTSVQIILRG